MDAVAAVTSAVTALQVSIMGQAQTCQKRFADVLSLPIRDLAGIGSDLQDEYGRFNLWTATMAVFAPDQACLDFRLKDVPEASQLFIKQLGIVATRLQQLREHFDPQQEPPEPPTNLAPWNVGDILLSIHETIDWLHRLSNVVRKAGAATQDEKAAGFVVKDEMGNDMTESLRAFYKAIIKRECKDISVTLLERLAQTMVIRRKRIHYRRSRRIRWARWALQQGDATRRRLNVLPVRTPQPAQDQDSPQEEDDHDMPRPTEKQVEPPSMLTVTVLERDKYFKQASPSRISRATSAPFQPSERLLVPPRPRAAERGREFVCDYCGLILPSDQVSDRNKWANHVKKDLDPYICLFDDCPEPCLLYSTSEEWLAHMSSQHRTRWHCAAREHTTLSMETREDLVRHMEEVHPGCFKKDQLGFIADSCARPLVPTIPACPFCSEQADNLDAHVGQHLQHFALISMPWPDDLIEGAAEGAGGASTCVSHDSSGSDPSERATLLDDFDDIPPTAARPGYMVIGDEKIITHDPPPLDHPVVYGEDPASRIERRFTGVDETLEQFIAAWKLAKQDQPEGASTVDVAGDNGGEMSRQAPDPSATNPSTLPEGAKDSSRVQRPVVMNTAPASPGQATRPVVSIRTGEKQWERLETELTSDFLAAIWDSGQNEGDVDCALLTAKCEWGVLGPGENRRPAAVLYMDVAVDALYDSTLQGCTIEMTLLDKVDSEGMKAAGPGLQRGERSWGDVHLQFTDCYGPVNMQFGNPYGSQSAPYSHVSRSSKGGKANDTITWDIQYDWAEDGWDSARPLPGVYHLAFVIWHNAHDFFLRIKASKKLASRLDRIKSRLRFSGLDSFSYDEVEIRFQFPDGYDSHLLLDSIVIDLLSAMEAENMGSGPIEDSFPAEFGQQVEHHAFSD